MFTLSLVKPISCVLLKTFLCFRCFSCWHINPFFHVKFAHVQGLLHFCIFFAIFLYTYLSALYLWISFLVFLNAHIFLRLYNLNLPRMSLTKYTFRTFSDFFVPFGDLWYPLNLFPVGVAFLSLFRQISSFCAAALPRMLTPPRAKSTWLTSRSLICQRTHCKEHILWGEGETTEIIKEGFGRKPVTVRFFLNTIFASFCLMENLR